MPQEESAAGEFGELSFEEAMKAALSDATEDEARELDIGIAAQEEAPESAEEPASEPVEAAAEEPAAEEPEKGEVPDKSLAKIMEREQRVMEAQAEYDQKLEALKPLLERVDRFEKAQLADDDIGMIRALRPDIDLKRLAEAAWYEAQGEKAPQKYLQKKEASQQNRELVERIAKLEREKDEAAKQQEEAVQQQKHQEAFARYTGELEAYAEAQSADTPLVNQLYVKEGGKQFVADALLHAAREVAAQNGGKYVPPEVAAKRVEDQLKFLQIQAAQNEKPAQPERTGASLRNSSTQVNPDREPADELSDEYLRRQACEAAGVPFF
jgi:hypothetical protein